MALLLSKVTVYQQGFLCDIILKFGHLHHRKIPIGTTTNTIATTQDRVATTQNT